MPAGLRVIGVLLAGGGLMLAGFLEAGRLRKRARLLAALAEALAIMRAEIAFALAPLPDVIDGLARIGPVMLRGIFSKMRGAWKTHTPFQQVWDVLIHEALSAGLGEDDTRPLSALGMSLGRFDAGTQTLSLDAAIACLGERRTQAEHTAREKSKVYGALGAAAGLAVVILLW
jgi:stage III sporulation protein AB